MGPTTQMQGINKMNAEVLLIIPSVRLSQKPNRFPLGLGYIAAVLEKEGFRVSILDLNIRRLNGKEEERVLADAVKDVAIVGMGGMITMFQAISRLTSIIKTYRPDLPIIVGGPIAMNLQEIILKNSKIDILVMGEGEKVVNLLVRTLLNKGNLNIIKGISYLKHGEYKITSKSDRIDDLDSLPFPAYHLFPFREYLMNRHFSTDIIGSRGCPYKCTFCFRNFGNKVRFRSVESIIEEIRFLKFFYNLKHIHLEDELFVQQKKYIEDFCDQIKRMGGITWSACARVNTISFDLLKLMKESYCTWLMLGLESFSNDILREMRKGITSDQINQVCSWINEIGIKIKPGLIIGMPSETISSVKMTVNGCIRNKISIDKWSYAFATPYPGTELYSSVKCSGLIKNNYEYIKTLCDVGDTFSMAINLTKFRDIELIKMRDDAVRKVNRGIKESIDKKGKLLKNIKRIRAKGGNVKNKIKNIGKRQASTFSSVFLEHFEKNLSKRECKKLFKKSIRMVEVEVFSFCNRKCWFCPNWKIDRHSENILMDEEIYEKILGNLNEIKYNGKISFSRYNEPLADPAIFKCLQKAKNSVPNANLHLNTNGDYLTKEMLEELYSSGLRSLHIQTYLPNRRKYSDTLASEIVRKKIEEFKLPYEFSLSIPMDKLEYKIIFRNMKIKIYARNFLSNGTDRGGIIEILRKKRIRESPCLVPFHDIYIDYNGKIVPCCNIRSDIDAHIPYLFGDLSIKNQNVFTIFCSEAGVQWRKQLFGYWKKKKPCDYCSFLEIPKSVDNLKRVEKISRKIGNIAKS